MPKILVGIVTYEKQKEIFPEFIKSLEVNISKEDIIFSDNSGTDDYFNFLKKEGFNVLKDRQKESRILNIISGRNLIRDYFLKSDYDYLFFVDSDILLPENAIENLLKCGADISTGVYLCNQQIGNERKILPAIYLPCKDDKTKTIIPPVKWLISEKIADIAVCGLGCCLIRRKVLEKIKFRKFTDSDDSGEDVAFCVDARNKGFSIRVNTAVKCVHKVRLFGKFTELKIVEQLRN